MDIKATAEIASKEETRMTSRQLQAIRTKERIYQSALKVMEDVGYKDASISAITQDAGVSTGSFYTYFSSKEQLLLHTFVKSDEIYQQAYKEVEHLPFPENLYMFARLAYFGLEQRGKKIMYGVMANVLSPEFKERTVDQNRGFYQYMCLLLQSGKEQGKLRDDIEVEEYVHQLFTILTGVEIVWCLDDFKESLSITAERAVRNLMVGMMNQEPQ